MHIYYKDRESTMLNSTEIYIEGCNLNRYSPRDKDDRHCASHGSRAKILKRSVSVVFFSLNLRVADRI